MSKVQKVSNNSQAFQVGGNMTTIINNGCSFSDIEKICKYLFELNFPKLVESASELALDNLKEYIRVLENKISEYEKEQIQEKLKTPNGQYLLNQSIQNAARFGHTIDLKLLSEATKQALLNNDSVLEQSFSLANQIIPQLTKEQLQMILAVFFVDTMSIHKVPPQDIDQYTEIIFQDYQSFPELKYSVMLNLVSLGVFTFNQFTGGNGWDSFISRYEDEERQPILSAYEANNMPAVKKVIEFYDKNQLIRFSICPAGHAIGYILVKNVLTNFPIDVIKDL